tara:strand:- start:864 stop:1772 length:909 start_codon:yes stop_codon:yes gene_type:complete
MTNKILLIQSQYSYIEDIFYDQLSNFYPVDFFIQKIVQELFNNDFDLVSIFENYNNFNFDRYQKDLEVILDKIILMQEIIIKSNNKSEKELTFNLLNLIYNCLLGDINSLNQLDKCFFNKKALGLNYKKQDQRFIIPLTRRIFLDLSYKFINILSFLNGQDNFLVKGVGSFYTPLSSTTLLGEPNIISFLPDYEVSLFIEQKLNNFSKEDYFNFLSLVEAKKKNIIINQFKDSRVFPVILRSRNLLINKKDQDKKFFSKIKDFEFKYSEINSFILGLKSSFRANLELGNKDYDKLCSLLIND